MTREEAIERIKSRYDKWALDDKDLEAIQYFFPDLKESEDERIRKEIISIIKQYGRICEKEGDPCLELNDCLAYLERQKGIVMHTPRYATPEQKSAEWSKEDERLLTKLMTFVDMECFDRECNGQDVIDWLKSFRPSWKPSEEQMRVFLKANPVNLMPDELGVYHSLYNDLKKL